tara:strand:- start:231 stop:401 length:171 start_codon:yes stop_codon:yes gene_type:complete
MALKLFFKYNEYQEYFGIFAIIYPGPVVQLDRMADFGSAGCRFESCQGHKPLFPLF